MKWLLRMVASTLVRRLTILALAVVLGWMGMGKAHAQTDNKEQAWNKCEAAGIASIQGYPTAQWRCNDGSSPYGWRLQRYIPGPGNDWISPPGQSFFPYVACPAGTTWDPATHKCHDPSACLAKPDIANKHVVG